MDAFFDEWTQSLESADQLRDESWNQCISIVPQRVVSEEKEGSRKLLLLVKFLCECLGNRRLPYPGATIQPEKACWNRVRTVVINPLFDSSDDLDPSVLRTS